MPKLSINDLRIALTADYTAKSEPDDKATLLRLKRDSVRAHNLATEMAASWSGQQICKGCMMGAALDALTTLTTPYDASEQERQHQQQLIVAYLIQEAFENHQSKDASNFAHSTDTRHTTH
ncbi:hypothetical protein [Endozoicomonas sp. SCSIO W0465]|uniref:hypothetical protein n=1 Tax=Endozoicomonas sp. SCSIO W0465 TaxID=2918516 RepID=UPI002075B7E2|nr:hypothetical protein [Endozoicomonas sp. SCSIO W0465]USE36759.1 hypothetical protein MJO57_00495 [Endozoicomonas sp. SCSIO W0465]